MDKEKQKKDKKDLEQHTRNPFAICLFLFCFCVCFFSLSPHVSRAHSCLPQSFSPHLSHPHALFFPMCHTRTILPIHRTAYAFLSPIPCFAQSPRPPPSPRAVCESPSSQCALEPVKQVAKGWAFKSCEGCLANTCRGCPEARANCLPI